MNREGIRLMTPERLGIASRRSWILSDLSFESMHQCRIEIDTETAARGAGGGGMLGLILPSCRVRQPALCDARSAPPSVAPLKAARHHKLVSCKKRRAQRIAPSVEKLTRQVNDPQHSLSPS